MLSSHLLAPASQESLPLAVGAKGGSPVDGVHTCAERREHVGELVGSRVAVARPAPRNVAYGSGPARAEDLSV